MSEHQPGPRRDLDADAADHLAAGDVPTTNQPLNAEPRPRFGPAAVTLAILAVAVVLILALTLF